MKRTRLKRYTALIRRTRLRRTRLPVGPAGASGEGGSAASSQPPRRPRANRPHQIPAKIIEIVERRSGKECEIGIEGCWGTARQKQHRITQKRGGRHRAGAVRSDRPSNILDSCGRCHATVTDHPAWAKEPGHGWSLEEWQEPTAEAVLYRGQPKYLTDDGRVVDHEEAA